MINLFVKLSPEDDAKLADLAENERERDGASQHSGARAYKSETIRRLIRRAHSRLKPRKERDDVTTDGTEGT